VCVYEGAHLHPTDGGVLPLGSMFPQPPTELRRQTQGCILEPISVPCSSWRQDWSRLDTPAFKAGHLNSVYLILSPMTLSKQI
jgi:hypothetical protein